MPPTGEVGSENCAGHDGGNFLLQLPADEFGDFQRAHPDAADAVHADDGGEGAFLFGRPLAGGTFRHGLAAGAQLLDDFGERNILAHGGAGEFEQLREGQLDGNGGELRGGVLGHGVRRRERGAGSGDAASICRRAGNKPSSAVNFVPARPTWMNQWVDSG